MAVCVCVCVCVCIMCRFTLTTHSTERGMLFFRGQGQLNILIQKHNIMWETTCGRVVNILPASGAPPAFQGYSIYSKVILTHIQVHVHVHKTTHAHMHTCTPTHAHSTHTHTHTHIHLCVWSNKQEVLQANRSYMTLIGLGAWAARANGLQSR